jgi:hypothetical protein
MIVARNSGGERTGEAQWARAHRQTLQERLEAQGYAPFTLRQYQSITGRFWAAIEKRTVGAGTATSL